MFTYGLKKGIKKFLDSKWLPPGPWLLFVMAILIVSSSVNEEWSEGTVDWSHKIQTTNLVGPFGLSAGS